MDNFQIEFTKISEAFYRENPFKKLLKHKEVFAERPLALYGSGALCHTILSVCRDLGINVTAICDTYKTGTYEDSGLDIISPIKLKKEYPDTSIIICSWRFADEIEKNLCVLGYQQSQIFRLEEEVTSLIYPSDFASNYLSGYKWAYNFFKDEISKKIILDRIKMYMLGSSLSRTTTASSYFEPGVITLCNEEVFVDGGAFTGDTAEEFIKKTKENDIGGYRRIYSFEPDEIAYRKAVGTLSDYHDVEVIAKGLWSSDTELRFYSDGGNAGSTFSVGVNTVSVPVTSIDSFFAGKPDGELPTFIKLDIEGAEREALIGAKSVIAKKHPKLAICVYHKPEDIYQLPKLINNIDPTYKLTLQQCEDGVYDTVMYAV